MRKWVLSVLSANEIHAYEVKQDMTKNDFPLDEGDNPVDITAPQAPNPEEEKVQRNRERYLAAERARWQARKK